MGIRMSTPLWVVDPDQYPDASEQRCFEWLSDRNDRIHISLYDAKEQEDIFNILNQLTGMEDADVVEALCEAGVRLLDDAEARLVNATFVRFSTRARDAGVLQTTAVRVVESSEGGLAFQWTASKSPPCGEPLSGKNHDKTMEMLELSCEDLRADMATEIDVWTVFSDLKHGVPPPDEVEQEDPSRDDTQAKAASSPTPHIAEKIKPVAGTYYLKDLPPAKIEPKDDNTSISGVTEVKVEMKEEIDEDTAGTVSSGKSRAWDPATGEWMEEDLPIDILAMIGKKSRQLEAEGYAKPRVAETDVPRDFNSVVAGARAVMEEYASFFETLQGA